MVKMRHTSLSSIFIFDNSAKSIEITLILEQSPYLGSLFKSSEIFSHNYNLSSNSKRKEGPKGLPIGTSQEMLKLIWDLCCRGTKPISSLFIVFFLVLINSVGELRIF